MGAAWAATPPDGAGAVTAGLATAWAVQAGAYGALAGRLSRGEDALRAWAGGIAARIAGVAVLAVAAGPAGWPTATLLVAYGAAIVVGLMLEVLWLWWTRAGHPRGR